MFTLILYNYSQERQKIKLETREFVFNNNWNSQEKLLSDIKRKLFMSFQKPVNRCCCSGGHTTQKNEQQNWNYNSVLFSQDSFRS